MMLHLNGLINGRMKKLYVHVLDLDDFLVQWGLSQRNFNTESLVRLEKIFSSFEEEKKIWDIERQDNKFLHKKGPCEMYLMS